MPQTRARSSSIRTNPSEPNQDQGHNPHGQPASVRDSTPLPNHDENQNSEIDSSPMRERVNPTPASSLPSENRENRDLHTQHTILDGTESAPSRQHDIPSIASSARGGRHTSVSSPYQLAPNSGANAPTEPLRIPPQLALSLIHI